MEGGFPQRIALGLDRGRLLDDFADLHEASTWSEWGDDDWHESLRRIMDSGKTEAYWNLTGVDVEEGVLRAAKSEAGLMTGAGASIAMNTDWELLEFKRNEHWWLRSHFFRDGLLVPNPFEADLDA